MRKVFYTGIALLGITFLAVLNAPVKDEELGNANGNHQTAAQEEEKAKQNYGEYVQVLKDGTVPDGKTFDRSKLPPNSYVNVYESPRGHGWQIVTGYADRTEYKGYGVDAADWTYTIPAPVASSTP